MDASCLHDITCGPGGVHADTAVIQGVVGEYAGPVVGGVFLAPDTIRGVAYADSAALLLHLLHNVGQQQGPPRVFEVYLRENAAFAIVERLVINDNMEYEFRIKCRGASDEPAPEFYATFVRDAYCSDCYDTLWAATGPHRIPASFYTACGPAVRQFLVPETGPWNDDEQYAETPHADEAASADVRLPLQKFSELRVALASVFEARDAFLLVNTACD